MIPVSVNGRVTISSIVALIIKRPHGPPKLWHDTSYTKAEANSEQELEDTAPTVEREDIKQIECIWQVSNVLISRRFMVAVYKLCLTETIDSSSVNFATRLQVIISSNHTKRTNTGYSDALVCSEASRWKIEKPR